MLSLRRERAVSLASRASREREYGREYPHLAHGTLQPSVLRYYTPKPSCGEEQIQILILILLLYASMVPYADSASRAVLARPEQAAASRGSMWRSLSERRAANSDVFSGDFEFVPEAAETQDTTYST